MTTATELISVTEKVVHHHLSAFAEGIESLMSDYTDDSIIITSFGNHVGIHEIRAFFESFLATATPEFWAAFRIVTQFIHDDIGYLTWGAPPFISMATDTLVIRNSRIAIQTFTIFK